MCKRYDVERAHRDPRADDDELARFNVDHARSCPECTGWSVPKNLPRDPERP